MGKSLVIVESPAKAKTINKYPGKDFIVKSSVGHVRDLPTSGSASPDEKEEKKPVVRKGAKTLTEQEKAAKDYQALVSRMGIDPEHGWAARYQVLPGKEKWSMSSRAWPKRRIPSISQPTWTAKGRPLRGTCGN